MSPNRYLAFLVPLAILVLLQVYFFSPGLIYVVLIISALLLFFTVRQFVNESKRKERVGNYLILPMIFTFSAVMFSTLMPFAFIIQILIFVIYLFINFYLRTLYFYFLKPERYKSESLENFSSYGNFLSFYFTASALYGFQSFLGTEFWQIIIFLLAIIILIVYQVFWTNKILTKQGILYIIILPLLYVEMAWAISFLSLSFYVLGLILSILYYIGIGLTRFYLIEKINGQILKIYLTFGFISIFAIIISSRWI